MAIIITEPALLRLMQLGSMGLPVGGFAHSQGLEYAVDDGWIDDACSCESWLALQLGHALARNDLAVIFRLYRALEAGDTAAVDYWNEYLLACRETRELRFADTSMGEALVRLLDSLEMVTPATGEPGFVTAFCSAAWQWHIPERACALAYSWSWLENQVAAATKLIPLGQTQAQRLLGRLQPLVPGAIETACSLQDEDIGAALPALAMASCLHETQYSRLFRS